MANRTLQFYGYAYGASNVQLNAHINGQVVFSGAVPTIDQPLPLDAPDMSTAPVLFTVDNSSLFPTEFSGNLPMTISVATGDGVVLGEIYSNYMEVYDTVWTCQTSNATIVGNVLTLGTVTEGSLDAVAVGQGVVGPNIPVEYDYYIRSANGDGTWNISWSLDVPPSNIGTVIYNIYPGNATSFVNCYEGTPANSDGTADPRSSVTIDDVAQNPVRDGADGTWAWIVPQGSTIAYNLNVGVGNVA